MTQALRAQHLRKLPGVDRLLEHPRLTDLGLRHALVRRVVVDAIAAERARVLAAIDAARDPNPPVAELDQLAAIARARLDHWLRVHPRAVLNGTGVLLHTNLGRAPLSAAARLAVNDAAGTCDLELDLGDGKRGSRLAVLSPLLAALFEAEDVLVVNNGAAALLLACTALAGGGPTGGVALSRGQHVEIGDSFRVAEMAAAGGVPVLAIGSTNRTHLRDYAAALQGRPEAALLWVHQSNFVQAGFVHQPELAQLAGLAGSHGVPLIADLGSGSMGVVSSSGEGVGVLAEEPTVSAYLEQGATVVTFSGDKLLGGPQAGILAGSARAIARCRRHPLARALRCGKLALAALHATAIAHASANSPDLPFHGMLAVGQAQLRARGQRLCHALGWSPDHVQDCEATIGGGSLPGQTLASVALVAPGNAQRAAACLRRGDPPLVGRTRDKQLWIDLRTLTDIDDELLLKSLRQLD
ncbi:L-seryl-tRNA(Sec) selenium transferase [Enhygromyxa salina]|uniref:L-seryl-tRNA(Sec) selenium transferase n=1 Tax=Enhygromyxa salina TaxID=215803 RepID=A0A0C2A754_9BACT|nr:L-seryl-tRNA(Sec) selenium transferase [Enhygromyxa salina]KIG19238.1 L-seryl-tRNA(Sec) selenium transferase [Enhygromyxa salina]